MITTFGSTFFMNRGNMYASRQSCGSEPGWIELLSKMVRGMEKLGQLRSTFMLIWSGPLALLALSLVSFFLIVSCIIVKSSSRFCGLAWPSTTSGSEPRISGSCVKTDIKYSLTIFALAESSVIFSPSWTNISIVEDDLLKCCV